MRGFTISRSIDGKEKKEYDFPVREVIFVNPIVEFCMSNMACGSQKTFEELEQDSNLDVLEYGCLSFCSQCAESLYAVVNGEIVEGETPEELKENIYRFIEENPLF